LSPVLWTQVAGTNIHKLVNGTFGQAFAQSPSSTKVKDIDPSGPWATEQRSKESREQLRDTGRW
jgi:hypothetical protein